MPAASKTTSKSSKSSGKAVKPATKVAAKAAPARARAAAAARGKAATASKAAKPAAKPAAADKPLKPVKPKDKAAEVVSNPAAAEAKPAKAKKQKLVRDSFTMPESEYALLGEVKKACLASGFAVKKSELLRVGVGLIRTLDNASLKKWIESLPPLKPGRPRKDKQAA